MIISELVLNTNHIAGLKEFYSDKLNLSISESSETTLTLNTQTTRVTFQQSEEDRNPFYHFAFNIPENQFKEAKNWALERVKLISLNGDDEFDFKSWNAHSIYFYDPAGNIIELIARHNLKNNSSEQFSGKSFLGISEIGLPVNDVENFFLKINGTLNIPEFSGDRKDFCAMGDDSGLFIIVPNGRKWFPDCDAAEIFPTIVKVVSYEETTLEFENLPYKIISQKS